MSNEDPEKSDSPARLTHLDQEGNLAMVDVSAKAETLRKAVARAHLRASKGVVDAIFSGALEKGEALAAARLAGILAAKKTGDLIPLCHPLPLTQVRVSFSRSEDGIQIESEAVCMGRTGVEMEAMTAAAVAGLTLYDMAKSQERGMTLEGVCLVEKSGGKSGHWLRSETDGPAAGR